MLIQENLSIQEKLAILTDAAKYDVSCTSSGAGRRGSGEPNAVVGLTIHEGRKHQVKIAGK